MSEYHVSVLLEESINNLKIRPKGIYVDVTFGAGGHSRSILNKLDANGHLYAFDQDVDALSNAPADERFTLINSNFRYMRKYLRLEGVQQVDGILADLGVSSHQLDIPERGFSYRFDAPLDMRMNESSLFSAFDVVNAYEEEQLVNVLSKYGEVRNAKTLAAAISAQRKMGPIRTTEDLNRILDRNQMGPKMKYYSQVYQAIRIEVNDELGALRDMLEDGLKLLNKGGRFAVITFHSIEDRMVKNFFKTGNVDGEVVKDDFGNIYRPFALVDKKVIVAGQEEQKRNSRARSAKLRVAEKL
ncbi:MAG: 16S rRNA (cytosine(1402)-N(4))-methyltransferase RsmH [Chitinophagales bacterium]|nr:16S rRNA (cytosine(1402)-N(4))-methyltransferase RsmH [Chitinophagales bacterium]